jgi:hypothetical protein
VVVVQHDQAGGLGSGGDQQVGDFGALMLTPTGQRVLDIDGATEDILVHGRQRPTGTPATHGRVGGRGRRREPGFEIRRRAARHQAALEQWHHTGGDGGVGHAAAMIGRVSTTCPSCCWSASGWMAHPCVEGRAVDGPAWFGGGAETGDRRSRSVESDLVVGRAHDQQRRADGSPPFEALCVLVRSVLEPEGLAGSNRRRRDSDDE